jgi:hypothetical protein
MAMNPKCKAMVQQAAKALGHAKGLTEAQLADIDSRIRATARRLAQSDPTWRSKSADQRTMEAATRAMQDIKHEAARKVANAQLQIVKTAATEGRIQAAHGTTRSGKLVHDIDRTADYVQGVKQEGLAGLMDTMDAIKSGQGAGAGRRVAMFLFGLENPKMTVDLAHEVFANAAGSTGNKIAQEGAKAWLATIEHMRTRFNAAGGDVRKLDYGYLPQPHDAARVRGAGRDAWVSKILPLLDRSRMLDEAGTPLNDADARAALGKVWETIATEGMNKQTPGEFKGTGARANAGGDARELHFKDANSYLDYLNNFGRGSMYDAMVGHVGRLARDIGLVERYGPNPNALMSLQFETAAKADGRNLGDLPRTFGLRPQSYWEQMNGTASAPQSARLAQIGTDVRNIETAGKLASAVLASVTDLGTYMVTTGYNKLPYWQAIANIGKTAASKQTRDFLTTHGIIAESMIGDLNRWTNDNIKATRSGRMANSVLRLSLMNAWTDTLRRAFSLTMMQGMARLAGKDWQALTEWDRTHMERKGLTADDWSVIRQAQLTKFQGVVHLTPESIHATNDPRANEVVSKVLGLIQDESEFAVLNPDLATKAWASGGALQRGTVKGELARSVMQFKSFPLAMVSRHWNRMLDMPKVSDGSAPGLSNAPILANRLLYAGAILVSTTALGAVAFQAKQVASGKDPVDMTGPHAIKFWGKAMAQGGGLSIVGDLLLNDPGNSASGFAKNLAGTFAGPAPSDVISAATIPIEAGWQAAKGKRITAGADTLRLVRSDTPYVNLWYAKAAIDHAGMHALQENLSPGYLGRMQQTAAKDWGQGYWWQPGTGGPQRAPDFGKAVGQ